MMPQQLWTILLFCLLGQVLSQDRKIKAVLNPGCKAEYNSSILVHVTAESSNDTLHHIWDFTSKPSVLVALTPLNSTLTIDWETFLWDGKEGAVVFYPKPSYMFSVIFDKIIEFNDVNDTARFNGENDYTRILRTELLNWTLISIDNDSEKSAVVVVEGRNADRSSNNSSLKDGSVRFQLKTFGSKDHGSMLPHLFHTTNASEITVVLDNLSTSHSSSRYALNLVTVSTDPFNTSLIAKKHKSLDDEHSPGIFTVAEMTTPAVENEKGDGYLQWRTVAYTSPDKVMTNSTDIIDYDINLSTLQETNGTVVYSIYGHKLLNMSVNSFNVSFGAKGDGYYRQTNYISWSLLCGFGQPAEEELSFLVFLVVTVSIGLPLILIVIGIFFFICKHISRKRDDLVLSH